MKLLYSTPAAVCAVLALASTASACPLCESETGRQVRAGIFDDNFGKHAVLTLLPFPVLIGLVALIYYGPPSFRRTRRDAPGPAATSPGRTP